MHTQTHTHTHTLHMWHAFSPLSSFSASFFSSLFSALCCGQFLPLWLYLVFLFAILFLLSNTLYIWCNPSAIIFLFPLTFSIPLCNSLFAIQPSPCLIQSFCNHFLFPLRKAANHTHLYNGQSFVLDFHHPILYNSNTGVRRGLKGLCSGKWKHAVICGYGKPSCDMLMWIDCR